MTSHTSGRYNKYTKPTAISLRHDEREIYRKLAHKLEMNFTNLVRVALQNYSQQLQQEKTHEI